MNFIIILNYMGIYIIVTLAFLGIPVKENNFSFLSFLPSFLLSFFLPMNSLTDKP